MTAKTPKQPSIYLLVVGGCLLMYLADFGADGWRGVVAPFGAGIGVGLVSRYVHDTLHWFKRGLPW